MHVKEIAVGRLFADCARDNRQWQQSEHATIAEVD